MRNLIRNALRTCLLLCTAVGMSAERPNIVFILSDDQGMNDVGCYGSEIPTPNIDAIARNGAKFESYYVASPVCTPSRFGLLTGKYPNRSQDNLLGALMFLAERDDNRGIRSHEKTIPEVLGKSGYRTALIGKWHLGHGAQHFFPNQHGFDYSYGTSGGAVDYFTLKYGERADWYRDGKRVEENGYSTDLITQDAVRYIKQQKSEKPFFLYLAYTAPHYGKGWDELTKKPTNILQAKEEDREKFAHIADAGRREFAGMVSAMDQGIGRVTAELKRQKLDRNTLVIFTCDNGADPRYGGSNKPFRGQKNQLFEGGIRVPCVAQWPGKIKPGLVIGDPVTALDFFPTFCDLAGVKTKGLAFDGNNIASLLFKNKSMQQRDLVWLTPTANALRRGPWKYFENAKEEMLFNLAADPEEKNNLADTKPELLAELKAAHQKVTSTFPAKPTAP